MGNPITWIIPTARRMVWFFSEVLYDEMGKSYSMKCDVGLRFFLSIVGFFYKKRAFQTMFDKK